MNEARRAVLVMDVVGLTALSRRLDAETQPPLAVERPQAALPTWSVRHPVEPRAARQQV